MRPRVVGLTASPGQGESSKALDISLGELVARFPKGTQILRPTISCEAAKQEWRQVIDSHEHEKLMEAVLSRLRSSLKTLGLASDLLSSSDQPLRHLAQIKEALYKSTQQSGGKLRDKVLSLISALQIMKSFGPFAVSQFLVDAGIIPEGSSR